MTTEQKYDLLVAITSEEFVKGCIAVGGYTDAALEKGLHYATGYCRFENYVEFECEASA